MLELICRPDRLGVSSAVRVLGLEPGSYESLVSLFHSGAWTAESLRRRWHTWLADLPLLMGYAGRLVLCSDGCKVSNEGSRMPGVRRLHQESLTSSKGATIFGHMFGALTYWWATCATAAACP